MRADRLVLLADGTDEHKYSREKVRERLEATPVDVVEQNVRTSDPAAVAYFLAELVRAQPFHRYKLNVSTGPRPVAIGGLIAAPFWGIRAYYAEVDEALVGEDPALDAHPYVRYRDIPVFRQEVPRDDLLDALDLLIALGGRASHRSYLKELVKADVIRPKRDGIRKLTHAAKQSQYSTISMSLMELDFAAAVDAGRVLAVTDEGRIARHLFRGEAGGALPAPGVTLAGDRR